MLWLGFELSGDFGGDGEGRDLLVGGRIGPIVCEKLVGCSY